MNEWTDNYMNRWIDEMVKGRIDNNMNRWIYEMVKGRMNIEWMNRWNGERQDEYWMDE